MHTYFARTCDEFMEIIHHIQYWYLVFWYQTFGFQSPKGVQSDPVPVKKMYIEYAMLYRLAVAYHIINIYQY